MFARSFNDFPCAANWIPAAHCAASPIIFAPLGNLTGAGSNQSASASLALGQARNSRARRMGSGIRVGEHPKERPREQNMAGVGKVQAVHRCASGWRGIGMTWLGQNPFRTSGQAQGLRKYGQQRARSPTRLNDTLPRRRHCRNWSTSPGGFGVWLAGRICPSASGKFGKCRQKTR